MVPCPALRSPCTPTLSCSCVPRDMYFQWVGPDGALSDGQRPAPLLSSGPEGDRILHFLSARPPTFCQVFRSPYLTAFDFILGNEGETTGLL